MITLFANAAFTHVTRTTDGFIAEGMACILEWQAKHAGQLCKIGGKSVASRRCFDDNAHYNSDEYFDRDNAKIINSCEYNSDRGSSRNDSAGPTYTYSLVLLAGPVGS